MLYEMAGAVQGWRFVTRPYADPKANTDSQHVRHFCRCDREAILE